MEEQDNTNSLLEMKADLLDIFQSNQSKEYTHITIKKSKPEKLLMNPYWYEGKRLLQTGRFKDAIDYFDMSIRIDEQFTPAYIGKGEALFALNRTNEAIQLFDHVLSIQPEHAQAAIGRGRALLKLRKYSEALTEYELTLEIINRFVSASSGNGQAISASKYYRETFYAYEVAINYDTHNEQFYHKMAALLQAIYDNPYEDAPPQLHFISPHMYLKLGDICFNLGYYIPAYNAYLRAETIGIETFLVYMKIGDCLAINNCIREAIFHYSLAIEYFAKTNNATMFRFTEHTLCTSRLSANELFELLCRLLTASSLPEFAKAICHDISQLYDQCLNHLIVSPEIYEQCMDMLEKTLWYLSVEQYNEALLIISQQNAMRLSYLLIALVPDEPKHLEHQLSTLILHEPDIINDAMLAAHLHMILPKYHVSQEENDLFYTHSLIIQKRYMEAEQLLTQLADKHDLTPALLWSVFLAMQQCGSAPLQQIAVLQRFIDLAPKGEHIMEAWLYLGDLYSVGEGTGRDAIRAYQAAEDLGAIVPRLHAFRTGNWDAVPALRSDPDYLFPTVVVLDLECAYKPDAQPGSTIYEIAAVRCKGKTELKCYQAFVRPNDPGVKLPQRCIQVQDQSQVVAQFQEFIGDAIVVGHNIQEFDAKELRAIQVTVDDNQIIDTLHFARLLYPDSIHHHLGLLCKALDCTVEGQSHEALPDARACAALFQALSCELMLRGDDMITGFRAFISPNSAFDRAVLQPRRIPADPSIQWQLHPAPHTPHPLIFVTETQITASPHMIEVLSTQQDALVELYDPHAKYISAISSDQHAFVVFGTRHRLERALLVAQNRSDIFVLPDLRTLLCPERVRQRIETQSEIAMKLTLFCLYQASHNHDARTLYPWRIPGHETLRDMLLADCCGNDADHTKFCPAFAATQETVTTAPLLLSTHDVFIQHQRLHTQQADLIIVDDADALQMRFAQTLAESVDSAYLSIPTFNREEQREIQYLTEEINLLAHEYIDSPGTHERLHLHIIASEQNTALHDRLTRIENTGPTGRQMVQQIQTLLQNALSYHKLPQNDERVRAYWLDLWFAASESENQEVLQKPKKEIRVVRWRFCALDSHIQDEFKALFLQGFKQHIVCGSAISLGTFQDTFIRRFFGLDNNFTFAQDSRPPTLLVIPPTNSICPSSFLNRVRWAREVGQFLSYWMHTKQQSLVVTLHELSVAHALTEAFAIHRGKLPYNVLSPHLNWPTAKIAERLADPDYRSLTLLTPALRRTVLDGQVEIEATGPLRFLNQRDPLVAAHMRVFANSSTTEGIFQTYLLPQALLELKLRLASQAKAHLLLDSAISSKFYFDTVRSLLPAGQVQILPPQEKSFKPSVTINAINETVKQKLEEYGYKQGIEVSDVDLRRIFETLWGTTTFNRYKRDDGTEVSQEHVVRAVFEKKDQLVIVATGGGKSLCFQLPAILLAEDTIPRVTLVITPLLALMRDQIHKLHEKGIFSVIAMNSEIIPEQRQEYLNGIKNGDYSIIYIAPEQIRSLAIMKALRQREIGLIAVDEAHCVSQWGHDFRTDYFVLKQWIEKNLCVGGERDFPMLALTATARHIPISATDQSSEISTARDIETKLGLRLGNPTQRIITSPKRPELIFQVERLVLPCIDCGNELEQIEGSSGDTIMMRCAVCSKIIVYEHDTIKEEVRQKKLQTLIKLLTDTSPKGLRQRWERPAKHYQRGVIYCRTRNETSELLENIQEQIPELAPHIAAYHGKLSQEKRTQVYQRFIADDDNALRLIIATNAFGMGVDVARLGFVIHFDVPSSPESYYQEAGRAGRNFSPSESAQCILLYHESDLEGQRWLMRQNAINEREIISTSLALCRLYQKRSHAQELLVANGEIALHAGVDKDKINTLLYYLEHHTSLKGKPVIEREDDAQYVKYLRWHKSHRIDATLPLLAAYMVRLFQGDDRTQKFQLDETEFTPIDINELTQELQESDTFTDITASKINEMLYLLMGRGIITYLKKGYIQCRGTLNEVNQQLEIHKEAINHFLLQADADNSQKLRAGKYIQISLNGLEEENDQGGILEKRKLFLDMLSHQNADTYRLFQHFKRATRRPGPDRYKVQLFMQSNEKVLTRLDRVFRDLQKLCQKITNYSQKSNNPFVEVKTLFSDSELEKSNQQIQLQLILLDILNIIFYQKEAPATRAKRIHFLQEPDENAPLNIDLTDFHLQKAYREAKLRLMSTYAALPPEKRTQLFEDYFLGKNRLLEPYTLPKELTDEQRGTVQLSTGYHLIEGVAGSGKTRVLVEQLIYLTSALYVPLERILVLTHNKNALEKIHQAMNKNAQGNGQRLGTTTLNALGDRIFLQYHTRIKRPDGLSYYPTIPQLLPGNWKQQKAEDLRNVDEAIKWVSLQYPQSHYVYDNEQCLKVIQGLRQRGIFIATSSDLPTISYILYGHSSFHDYTPQYRLHSRIPSRTQQDEAVRYQEIYNSYRAIMGEKRLYTYDDQILFAFELLQQYPHLQQDETLNYEYVLIDEAQDITLAGAKFIRLLSLRHGNVFAYGDSVQDIRAQKERVSCQEWFQQIAGAAGKSHQLTTNFRSTPAIQDFVNEVRKPSADMDNHFMDEEEFYTHRKGLYTNSDASFQDYGEKPIILSVQTETDSVAVQRQKSMYDKLTCTMLEAVRYHYAQLPASEKNSVAIIAGNRNLYDACKSLINEMGYRVAFLETNSLYQSDHIDLILLYLRLVIGKQRNNDIEKLLYRCIQPSATNEQVRNIQKIALQEQCTMIDILTQPQVWPQIPLSAEQKRAIQRHLALIKRFSSDSSVADLWQTLKQFKDEYEDGPLAAYSDDDTSSQEQEKIVNTLQKYNVEEAIDYVERHLAFIEPEKIYPYPILATIDYAKGQEFDTVFLLGAHIIKPEERLYVGASRAKKRLFLLTDEQSGQGYLSNISVQRYTTASWSLQKK